MPVVRRFRGSRLRSLGPASIDELATVAFGVGPEGEELEAVWTGLEGSCTAGRNPQRMPRTQLHDLALDDRAPPPETMT